MKMLFERTGRLLQELQERCYPQSIPVTGWKKKQAPTRLTFQQALEPSGWEDMREPYLWGGHRARFWFRAQVTLPDDFAGQCVVFRLTTGKEGEWDACNPQFAVYVNGERRQGFDVNHRELFLTDCAKGGETYDLTLSAFTGDQNFTLFLRGTVDVLDRETEQYYYDVKVPYEIARLEDPESDAYGKILPALTHSLNLLDLRQRENGEAYRRTLSLAREALQKDLYEKVCRPQDGPVMLCVGHTHIDVAWLWTLSVTRDKAVRSFSTVLELMRRYPEYTFMSSQPQLYEYVKEDAPEVYEEIQKRVAEGRWEVNGGMWLEADCNLASGESLVRQFLLGKQFFRQEFGKDNDTLWLPDVFGYSAALPQIMQKSGVPYFMTTKISWSEFNKLPYDTFLWEGIDGSRVLTHFVPTRDDTQVDTSHGENDHFTTYNGMINPSQVRGGWKRYQQKDLNEEVLNSFGYGDGGGGPTRDMLEQQRRLQKGLPGCPRTEMTTVSGFFHRLEKTVKDRKELPVWVGELYLEYHRGTYTSMARNKKYNRRSEFAALDTETFSALASCLARQDYPAQMLHDQWKVILRNQFHDILPGSSILEVYEESKQEYEKVLHTLHTLMGQSKQALLTNVEAPKGAVAVWNPGPFDRGGVVACPLLPGQTLQDETGSPLPAQPGENGQVLVSVPAVPARGYRVFTPCQMSEETSSLVVTPTHIENDWFRICLNEKGQFTSFYDKRAGRELLKEGQCGNVLMSYEDKPHNYDAWDLNCYYTEKSWPVDDVNAITVESCGPVQGSLRIERPYLSSTVCQIITVYRDIPRVDIRHEIDWKESQIFLKLWFPLDLHANEATYEIQYGNVTRPTHRNTSWDYARFEVCCHKWMDVSEDGYGVSFLNDCKYGCSVQGSDVGLSLLKSALYPNPEADKEHHSFTFSVYPHEGSWKQAGTVQQAYDLNDPLLASMKENEGGFLPGTFSLVRCLQDNVAVEVVKQAEDGNGWIVRLYEFANRRTKASLQFGFPLRQATLCDMQENDLTPLSPDEYTLDVEMRPYAINTVRVTFA